MNFMIDLNLNKTNLLKDGKITMFFSLVLQLSFLIGLIFRNS